MNTNRICITQADEKANRQDISAPNIVVCPISIIYFNGVAVFFALL